MHALLQDSEGFIWLGGENALVRYDGYNFKQVEIINKAKPDKAPQPARAIGSLFEDSQQRMWFGTGSGLSRYNKESNNFTSFGAKNGFVNDVIRSIVEDPLGRLWLGTNSGVVSFDPNT